MYYIDRIFQSIHDGLCQQLVGISFLAKGLEDVCEAPAASVIATEIVQDGHISDDKLSEFDLLILPDVEFVSDSGAGGV